MKAILLVAVLATASFTAQAKRVFESNEIVRIPISERTLTCDWVETAAHAGTIRYPGARLALKMSGNKFTHQVFTGVGYVQGDFTCEPTLALLDTVDRNGTVQVKKKVTVDVLVYQDYKDGPITAVETIEKIRLDFSNGNYLESSKSKREKK